MNAVIGIIGLLLLGVGAHLHRREQDRRAHALYVGYVHWRDWPSPWEYLVAGNHPRPNGADIPVLWFESLDEVVHSLRTQSYKSIHVSQPSGDSMKFVVDHSLSDAEIQQHLKELLLINV
jgi:hypothetical protein